MNILVTGASGFIARAFLRAIDKSKHNVHALSLRRPQDFDIPGIKHYYEQDISQPFRLNAHFDCVFHLAAHNITNVGTIDPQKNIRVNVDGTRNILHSAEIRNFVFMSTAKVYKSEGRPLLETSPLAPQNPYEQSKLEAENLIQKEFSGEKAMILRSVNVIGPGQRDKAVIPIFLKSALQNLPLDILTPRKLKVQFLFVDDLCELFSTLLAKKWESGIFNIASSDQVTIENLAKKIIQMCRSSSAINYVEKHQGVFSEVIADKIKGSMGWTAKTTIDQILNIYWKQYKKINV